MPAAREKVLRLISNVQWQGGTMSAKREALCDFFHQEFFVFLILDTSFSHQATINVYQCFPVIYISYCIFLRLINALRRNVIVF